MPLPPKSNTAYDPAKAATYNQLRQQGLSENQAADQAGISKTETKHYMVNEVGSNDPKSASYNPNYGKMGPQVSGQNFQDYNKSIASGKTEQEAYAEIQAKKAAQESDRAFIREEQKFLDGKQGKPGTSDGNDDEEFDRADMPINAKTPPGSKTVTQTFTNNTETVSGGGSTTTYAATKKDNPASLEAQKAVDAKQAQLDNFYEENPSPYERKQMGLPPLSQEEAAQRSAKLRELNAEKTAAQNAADDLKTTVPGSTVTVPNTTTTENTTTYEQTNSNTPVNAPTGADPTVNQQAGAQLTNNYASPGSINGAANDVVPGGGQITDPNAADYNADYAEFVRESQIDPPIQSAAPAPADNTYPDAGAGRGFVNPPLVQPEPQQTETFNEGQSTITTVTDNAAPVDQQTFETGGGGGNQGTITRVSTEATDVDAATDPAATGGGQSTITGARGGNTEENAANAAATQEAATKLRAQEQAALQARLGQSANGDWRVRLRLAPNATYLYKAEVPGILAPLKASDGVIFPYTPSITTSYNANYDTTDLTHSNYRGQFYKNSNTGDISLNGAFTAQDTIEAEYMLAVIHFFRSVTKMFYGQDAERGAPPPLVYLSGFGPYQFNGHPCVVKSFNYALPTDVDYVRVQPNNYGVNLLNRRVKQSNAPANTISSVVGRLSHAVDLLGNILKKGALPGGGGSNPSGQPGVAQQAVYNTSNATYVPTKIEIQLTLLPIQTRNQVSQQFGLKDYANGALLRGGFW